MPSPVSVLEAEAGAVRRQLEEVLKSPGFARNERLSRFLRFVVDRHIEGRSQELKESVVGIEVFGREPAYDTRADPVVRTEARRLRARLKEYYDGPGAGDTLVIDLPKGGYVPVIRLAAHVLQVPASNLASDPRSVRSSHLHRLALTAGGVIISAIALMLLTNRGDGTFVPDRRPSTATTSSAEDLFRRARASEMRPAARGVEITLDLFEQLIEKDGDFAPAYAGIAAMEAERSAFDRFNLSERAEMISKGWAAATKAIQLAPRSADAHDALGMMQAREGQWVQAERSFRRAIYIAPRDPLWRDHFALFLLLPLGRIEEAIRELRTAEGSDPHSRKTHDGLHVALKAIGRFDEADANCIMAAENDEQSSACWSDTLLREGKTNEALAILENQWKSQLLKMGAESLGVAYAQAGRIEDAERVATMAPQPARKVFIFAALRDKDRTFEFLDQMIPMGPTRVGRLLIFPEFAFLRGDPRLTVLRKRVGLPA
jgi:tetratricopeptide (TPR) repeat protein